MRRLILRPGAIGDCILSIPAMEHLVCEYTEIWIPSPVVPLIQFADKVRPLASTGIDLVGVGNLATPAPLEKHLKSFDSAVSWYGANRASFRDALTATGVPCAFLPALPPNGYRGHATAFFADQVGANPKAIPRIQVNACSRRDAIVIHPFSGSKQKNWPLATYRELASALNRPVEWTAGPEEDLAGAHRFEDLAQLARWLSGARLYIGNDSGITHLAAAVGIPTIALFGPTDPIRWAPRGDNVTVIRAEPIEELPVETVLAAVNRQLNLPSA
ncbi:MAG: glycosyltransferase family 9 protein [Acidobacteriota bacterium]|nr:glycosyltransferase family 9 protein [Acidobacteriota bacterium]